MSINGNELKQLGEAVSKLTELYRLGDRWIAANLEEYREAAIKASDVIIKQTAFLAARINKFDTRMAEFATLIETRELCTLVRALDHPALGAVVLGHTQVLVLSRTIDAISEILLAQELENLSVDDLSETMSLLTKGLYGDAVVAVLGREPERLSVGVLRERMSHLASQHSALAAKLFPGQNLRNPPVDDLTRMIPVLITSSREIPETTSTNWMLGKIADYLAFNTTFWERPTLIGFAGFTNRLSEALREDPFFLDNPLVTQHIARYIANWVVQHDRLTKFDDQSLANLVGEIIGSSRAVSDQVNPMDHIAVHLFSQRNLEKFELHLIRKVANYFLLCNLAKFKPQQLVDIVNGLSRAVMSSHCESVFRILDHIAAHLSLRNLADFTSEQIAKLLHGLNQVVTKLHQQGPGAADPNTLPIPPYDLENLTSQPRANWVINSVANYILQRDVKEVYTRHLADLAVGFSKVVEELDCKDVPSALDFVATSLFLQHDLAGCEPQQIVNLVNSFSQVGKIPEHLLGTLGTYVAKHVLKRNLAEFKPQQLVELVYGFGQGLERLDYKNTLDVIEHIARHIKGFSKNDLANFKPQQLVELVNSLGKVVTKLNSKPVFEAIIRIARHISKQDLAGFTSPQLANLVSGFVRAGTRDGSKGVVTKLGSRQVLGAIIHIAKPISKRDLAGFEPSQLARLVSELSQAGTRVGFNRVRRAIVHAAEHILKRDLAGFEPLQLANLVEGLIQADPRANCKPILKAVNYIVEYSCHNNLELFKNTEFCKKTTKENINATKKIPIQLSQAPAFRSAALTQAAASVPHHSNAEERAPKTQKRGVFWCVTSVLSALSRRIA